MEYTVVLGVDKKHLVNLKTVLPNWLKYQPELFEHPFVIFYDRESTNAEEVYATWSSPLVSPKVARLNLVPWPPLEVTYPEGTCKWDNQQRHKMLAGFVHAPPTVVDTPYWLKLDLDVLCTQTGAWVLPWWFNDVPAIVAPPWGYTKPIDQMDKLDEWANVFANADHPPLCIPRGDHVTMLRHHRICSWLGFFNTKFSQFCSEAATATLGLGQIPVPSQDGFHWYMARRFGWPILRANIKATGWDVKSNFEKARKAIECLNNESST